MTIPTSPNLYVTKKLNNMDEARLFKSKHNDWSQLYYKILKEIEVMVDSESEH